MAAMYSARIGLTSPISGSGHMIAQGGRRFAGRVRGCFENGETLTRLVKPRHPLPQGGIVEIVS